MVELFRISQRKQQQKYFDHRKVTLCKVGSSRMAGMVLAAPVLNNSLQETWKNRIRYTLNCVQ